MNTVEGVGGLSFTEGKSRNLGDGNLTGFEQCSFWEPGKNGRLNRPDWVHPDLSSSLDQRHSCFPFRGRRLWPGKPAKCLHRVRLESCHRRLVEVRDCRLKPGFSHERTAGHQSPCLQ